MESPKSFAREYFIITLGLSVFVGIGFYIIGVLRNHSLDFWYLGYNLGLALVPLLLSVLLVRLLKTRRWVNWLPLLVTFLWILFLPNSFYILTDFIHLTETPRVDIVQDVVMLTQFSFTGLAFGFVSLYLVHRELIKRISTWQAGGSVALLLLLCSFAVYLGRDLRWNSWDVIMRPIPLAVDVFEHMFTLRAAHMTLSFFILLGTIYAILWQGAKALSRKH